MTEPDGKALDRVPEAMRLLSLSRSVIYELIRSGRLRTVKEAAPASSPPPPSPATSTSWNTSGHEEQPHDQTPCPWRRRLHWDEARQRWTATLTVGYTPAGKRIVRNGSG
jgi:hypothetical protein